MLIQRDRAGAGVLLSLLISVLMPDAPVLRESRDLAGNRLLRLDILRLIQVVLNAANLNGTHNLRRFGKCHSAGIRERHITAPALDHKALCLRLLTDALHTVIF